MGKGEAHYQRAKLIGGSGRVNVGLELARGGRVKLCDVHGCESMWVSRVQIDNQGSTNVQLVQLRLHRPGLLRVSQAWQQRLRNGVDDSDLVWIEGRREAAGVHLARFPVQFIIDILAASSECSRLTVIEKLC